MANSRRLFLSALGSAVITIPIVSKSRLGTAAAAETPKLDLEDSLAKALGYVHEAPNASKRCGVCQLYKGSASSKWGECVIFSGKLVNAGGWCSSWSA